jgi:hypothetical protein
MSHWSPEMELVKAPSPVVHSPSAEAWLPATLPESVNSPVVSIDAEPVTTAVDSVCVVLICALFTDSLVMS